MRKLVVGGAAAVLLAVGAVLLWMGINQSSDSAAAAIPPPPELPDTAGDAVGAAPPEPPSARAATREERRFQRYDRNRDGIVSRIEMLSTRTNAFKALDTDGNNLLSFEEWAVKTSDRFAGADADRSGGLTPAEFATTAPPRPARPRCGC